MAQFYSAKEAKIINKHWADVMNALAPIGLSWQLDAAFKAYHEKGRQAVETRSTILRKFQWGQDNPDHPIRKLTGYNSGVVMAMVLGATYAERCLEGGYRKEREFPRFDYEQELSDLWHTAWDRYQQRNHIET